MSAYLAGLTLPFVVLTAMSAMTAWGAVAQAAEPSGSLAFVPASGVDAAPLTAVSTGVCSDPRGTNLQLRVSGAGFPDPTNVTPNLKAAIYPVDPTTGGYDVPLQDTLRDFAAQQNPPATLSGRYEFTLICKKPIGKGVFGTYTGSIVFTTPGHYQALTATTLPTTRPAETTSASPQTPATSTKPPLVQPPAAVTSASRAPTATSATPKATGVARSTAHPAKSATPSVTGTASPATSQVSRPVVTSRPTITSTTPQSVPSSVVPTSSPSSHARGPVVVATSQHGGRSSGALTAVVIACTAIVGSLGLLLRRRIRSLSRPGVP